MKRKKTFEAIILLGIGKLIITLVGSLFFFNSPEAHGWIWPCLVAAMIGLAIYGGYQAWGKPGDDPTLPTVVASLPDEMSASAVVVMLEAHNINARAVGGYTSGFQTEIASDVKVVVAARDAEKARAAIETVAESVS